MYAKKKVIGYILSCTSVSNWGITIRVSVKPINITIVQVYAPLTDQEDQEVEDFYEELGNATRKVPNEDIRIVQGVFNAKVDPDAYDNWAGTVGQYGNGTTNDRRLRNLEFAINQRLAIANTLYLHKLPRRTICHAPNGETQPN